MEILKKESHQPSYEKVEGTESDVLIRCRKNALKLEEMINRLGFIMGEIEGALGTLNRKPRDNEAVVLYQAAFAAGAADRSPRD